MKRIISIFLTLTALFALCMTASAEAVTALPFKDVKSGAWYEDAVKTVYTAGIMEGKGDGKFAPNASMTRAELVTVLCRLSGDDALGKGSTLTFRDTKKNAWYADSVAWAVECGIVSGYTDNTFKPNKAILRQELAKMFVTFLEYMKLPLEGTPLADSFADSARFPSWAAEFIEKLRVTGLVGGDTAGNFNPAKGASRAEIATVITRLLAHIENNSAYNIVSGRKFNYEIVYDDSDTVISEYATDLIYRMKIDMKLVLTGKKASVATDSGKPRIILGNVEGTSDEVYSQLDSEGDFAVTFSGKDLIVVANDAELYTYLFKMFESQIVKEAMDGELQLPRDFGITYSEDLKDMDYYEYCVEENYVEHKDIYGIVKLCEPFTSSQGNTIEYRIFVPYDYDPEKKYPLLLSMHGSGEDLITESEDVSSSLRVICNLFNIEDTPVTEAIIVCPQCPIGKKWVETDWGDGNYSVADTNETKWLKAVVELLGKIEEEYSIDTDRRYIGGLSMGGFGTWDLIMRHTELFAAAVPICGGADPAMAEKLRDFPIYTSHGDADNVVPVEGTREMVDALRAAGNTKVIYDELPGDGHVIWHTVTQNPEVIKWLFSHRLSDRG